jgi:translation initiation factor IF-3
LAQIKQALSDVAIVDEESVMGGRQIHMTLAPAKSTAAAPAAKSA